MPANFDEYREPEQYQDSEPPMDFPGLQDAESLRARLEEEYHRRLEAERRIKEQEERLTPMIVAPEVLSRIFAEGVRISNLKKGASIVCMPTVGSAGAPETFKGTNSKLLPEFFRRFEVCLAEAEIDDGKEKLRHLLKYVSSSVGDWVQGNRNYKVDNYDALKKALLKLYDNPETSDAYTKRDLAALVVEYAGIEVKTQDTLSERWMVFETMSDKLLELKKISKDECEEMWFKTFTPKRREAIREHLTKAEPWHPRDKAFTMEKVSRAAKHLLAPTFDEEIKGDPRTTGQRLVEEAKRQKKEEEAVEARDNGLYDVIGKMRKLTLSDPVYETHYAYLCRNFPDAANLVARPAGVAKLMATTAFQSAAYKTEGTPETSAAIQQRTEWAPRMDWSRDKCFYCVQDGCNMNRCPALATDIKDGLVVRDGLTLHYKTGERVYRRDVGIRVDVMSKKARDEAFRQGKDGPPHQSNAYVIDESEYSGYYIGIQEIEPDEEEVNAYTLDEEEDEMVGFAEAYYQEMIRDGLDDDAATERAWVMATTRSGKATKDARDSAKPYDREKGKKRAGNVRFADDVPESSNQSRPAMNIPFHNAIATPPPANPAPRFPPSGPMPSKPVNVPKPAANDWPRTATVANQGQQPIAANPAIATAGKPALKPLLPYPSVSKVPTVPEIDMTMKEPTPKYRFTSDVEESVNVGKTIERLLGGVMVTVALSDLLALSPAMRKHLTEMTKTKRVPTVDTFGKAKKVMVVNLNGEEEGDEESYDSMAIVETTERTPRYSGSLPRVQAEINGVSAVGMMDTGSQINLMTREFWMKTGLPLNEGRKIRMQGVNLSGDQSVGICEHVEVPFAGVVTRAHFHIFEKGPYPFILGQPWIQDHLLAITETGLTNKILIRDFRDPKNWVTMILRNDPDTSTRGDLPTVVEMGMPPIEVSAYAGIVGECVIEPKMFDLLEERLEEADDRLIVTIDALTGKQQERGLPFPRQL